MEFIAKWKADPTSHPAIKLHVRPLTVPLPETPLVLCSIWRLISSRCGGGGETNPLILRDAPQTEETHQRTPEALHSIHFLCDSQRSSSPRKPRERERERERGLERSPEAVHCVAD
ncbi:hypothetical protein QJS10_CPB12g01791 [Acorus calamus]|uniref:Uncharacterized protein n=1 Tax=Acorus calamus TaxID=4465 RepID=A0AAV9DM60_ACOCL|nr:hypothetical protein QJS10_CPB12g01791 [Acorus calamus]